MSFSKFATGTVLATPAIGGGSYIVYEELTKEETSPTVTPDSSSNTNSQHTVPNGENTTTPQTTTVGATSDPQPEAENPDQKSVSANVPGENPPNPALPKETDQENDSVQDRDPTQGAESGESEDRVSSTGQ